MSELGILTALIAGLLGSAHCVAMCGGIATALGMTRAGEDPRRTRPLLYQLGRITSYGCAGALAGALGAATGAVLAIGGWSEILRLATALVVVIIGLDIALGAGTRARWLRAPERVGALLWRRVAPALGGLVPTRPALRALSLGLLWGWLPCGLVYSVLLAAAVSGSASGGAAIMLAFGLGTLPAMLGLSYAGARLPRAHGSFARVLGALIVACGLWTATMPIASLTGVHEHVHPALVVTP
jgi:sulfite exporter TauE/SafE